MVCLVGYWQCYDCYDEQWDDVVDVCVDGEE